MRAPRTHAISTLLTAALALAGCEESTGGLGIAEGPPDAGCIRNKEPSSYDVYFVIDVSGSMGPFLRDLSAELVAFADALPQRDAQGRRVTVDYRVVAFVNDVRHYGCDPAKTPLAECRMTSVIAIQAAFEEAIAAGATDYNLNVATFNAEAEENLLDALATVIDVPSTAEARLVFIATDAPFREHPEVLNQNIIVRSSYASILDGLRRKEARVHAFTASALDGLTRPFRHQEALTTLTGSSMYRLQDLTGARQKVRETLAFIAGEAACN